MLTTESMLLENQLWHEQKISIWDSGQVSSDKKGNVRGQVNLKKQQNLRAGISIYRGAVTPDLLTSFWKWQKYHLLMLWITSKSVFTGTKHFHYGTENETFLETDRKQGKLNNCLETCRRKINFDKVRTEFTACCKHHNKTCRCTAGYQGSSNHSCPKHIFTALKLLEVFNEWQWGSRNRMELSTGAMVEETSPLRVQEIEIRHTKQFALLSWSRNTSGEKRVKYFLGGCWCALPVWPAISSPQGGLSGARMRRSGAGLHHLHYQGSNCYQKYQMYSLHSSPVSCESRRTDLFSAVASLGVSECTHYTSTGFICCRKGIHQWELTRTRQCVLGLQTEKKEISAPGPEWVIFTV